MIAPPWVPVPPAAYGGTETVLDALARGLHIADRIPIIAISHHQASTAIGTPLAGVIHHGVDLERYSPGNGDGGYAVFLGRMCPEKGVDTAIRVARRAQIPLRIAAKMSEAAEQRYFDQRVRPLRGGDIEYIGEIGGTDKSALLGGATCLLNPIAAGLDRQQCRAAAATRFSAERMINDHVALYRALTDDNPLPHAA